MKKKQQCLEDIQQSILASSHLICLLLSGVRQGNCLRYPDNRFMSQALTTQISLMHFKQCTHTVHRIVYWRQTSHNMGGKFYGVDLRRVPKPILTQTLPRQEKQEGSSRSCLSQSSTTPLLSSPFFYLRRRVPHLLRLCNCLERRSRRVESTILFPILYIITIITLMTTIIITTSHSPDSAQT